MKTNQVRNKDAPLLTRTRQLELENEKLRRQVDKLEIKIDVESATVSKLNEDVGFLNWTASHLERKVEKIRKQRLLLGIPFVLLTFPISLPAIIFIQHLRKKKNRSKHSTNISFFEKVSSVFVPQIAGSPINEVDLPSVKTSPKVPVLIWCPIEACGLTTQLTQLTELLRQADVQYKVSYHVPPKIEHPEVQHWVDSSLIDCPKVVFFMERYHQFERGFAESFHVFYANLDWLSPEFVSVAAVHADVVLCPVKHRFEELAQIFSNSKVFQLPWPTASTIDLSRARADIRDPSNGRIRVLYVGNDYDDLSRKNPEATVEAILSCTRTDLVFDLKFRSLIPDDVRKRLVEQHNVDKLIEAPVTADEIEALYEAADVNLIPNESEGNGLSIIESFAKGVVPAVLNGHPMKDVVNEDIGYLIDCEKTGTKAYCPLYGTSSQAISNFLSDLDFEGVRSRKSKIIDLEDELLRRQSGLESLVQSVLISCGLIEPESVPNAKLSGAATAANNECSETKELENILYRPATQIFKSCNLIDVYLTTGQRADHLQSTLQALLESVDASPYRHRLFVSVDKMDPATESVISHHEDQFSEVMWTREQMGLPYHWNSIIDRSQATISRTEERPDYVCYLQDDCVIQMPESYFTEMVAAANILNPGRLGFVSGYHSPVHSGFEKLHMAGKEYLLSDTVDGKNFMARPKLLYSIGKLPWWFADGRRRGNPGPYRGSHFDLWQWKESPNGLMHQRRVNIIIQGLCEHVAPAPDQSTWGNDSSDEAIANRVMKGKVYVTR